MRNLTRTRRSIRPLPAAMLTIASILGLTTSCGGDAETSSDRGAGSRPTSDSTSPSTSADREVTPATVSAEFTLALRRASTARVELSVFNNEPFKATGDADFSGSSTALDLIIDFRTSDQDGSYLVEAGQAVLNVPEGVELAEQSRVVAGNPWGYLLVTLDPVVAQRLITDFGTDAQVLSTSPSDDVESYSVTLSAQPTLETLGYSFKGVPTEATPENVSYEISFDSRHRLVRIECQFERYGENFVTFDAWGAAEGR